MPGQIVTANTLTAGIRSDFADAFLQNLTIFGFAVWHQRAAIHRAVLLTLRRINSSASEQSFHSEGPGFVWHDGYNIAPEFIMLHQFG